MNRESSAWDVNVTIEILTGMDDGALEGLENAYLTEIGEAPLSEDARGSPVRCDTGGANRLRRCAGSEPRHRHV